MGGGCGAGVQRTVYGEDERIKRGGGGTRAGAGEETGARVSGKTPVASRMMGITNGDGADNWRRTDVAAQKIISDSGANLVIMGTETAALMRLDVHQLEQPFPVQFGAVGARHEINKYVDGGAILDKIYVGAGLHAALCSVTAFTSKQMTVTYDHHLVVVRDKWGKEVLTGHRDRTTNLFSFDLGALLEASRSYVPSERGAWEQHTRGVASKILVKYGFEESFGRGERAVTKRSFPFDDVEMMPKNLGLGYALVGEAVGAVLEEGGDGLGDVDGEDEAEVVADALAAGFDDAVQVGDVQPPAKKPKLKRGAAEAPVTALQHKIVRQMHVNMGHAAPSTLAAAVRAGAIKNVPADITARLVERVNVYAQCAVCEAARRTHENVPIGSGAQPGVVGQYWSYDSVGPFNVASPEGYRYLALFEELHCGVLVAVPTKSTGSDIYRALRALLELNDSLGHTVRGFRVDAGTTEGSKEFAATLAGYTAMVTFCAAERQRANPVERKVHPLLRQIEALLAASPNVTAAQWLAAAFRAIDVMNSMTNTRSRAIGSGNQSPKELYYGVQPDYARQREFKSAVTWPKTGVIPQLQLRNNVGIWVGLTVSGLELVYQAGKRTPAIRDGVQELKLPADKVPTTKELVTLLEGNVVHDDGAIDVMARGSEVFSLRQWLTRLYKSRGLIEGDGGAAEEPRQPRERGEVGDIRDIGVNALAGLRQPAPVAALTRAAVAQGLVRADGRPAVVDARNVDAHGDAIVQRPAPEEEARLADDVVAAMEVEELDADGDVIYWRANNELQAHMALALFAVSGNAKAQGRTGVLAAGTRTCPESALDGIRRSVEDEGTAGNSGGDDTTPTITMDVRARRESLAQGLAKRRTDAPKFRRAVAAGNPDAEHWWKAMDKEINDLERRGQVRAVDVAKEGRPDPRLIIGTVINCTKKWTALGVLQRYKVRCALRGDQDNLVWAPEDLYSPSAKWDTYFLFVALATLYGSELSSLDITAAFGYNAYDRKEKMYFALAPEETRDGRGRYFEVTSLMYGLPEAGRRFYDLSITWMTSLGWHKGEADPCMLRRGTLKAILSTDNLLISNEPTVESRQELEVVRAEYKQRFEITVDEDVSDGHLGVHIAREPDHTTLSMSMKIAKLKDKAFPGLEDDVWPDHLTVLEPMKPSWSATLSDESPRVDLDAYRSIVGLCIFISLVRHDIITAVSMLASRMSCATQLDMEAAMHLSAYICYTRELGLRFYRGTQGARECLTLIGAADAAFRTHAETSRSHYGRGLKVVTDLGLGMQCPSGMFLAKSSASKGLVPVTIADAETGAAAELTKDIIYVKMLIERDFGMRLGGDGAVTIEEDNQATMQVATSNTAKSKNMRQSSHNINFNKSAIAMGFTKFKLVPTAAQTVNMFTKTQGAMQHARDVPAVMGAQPLTWAMLEMARKKYAQRHPLSPVPALLVAVAYLEGDMGGHERAPHDEVAGRRDIEVAAHIEERAEVLYGTARRLAQDAGELRRARQVLTHTEHNTRLHAEQSGAHRACMQAVKAGHGADLALSQAFASERAAVQRDQAALRADIAARQHDSPRWCWYEQTDRSTMPRWYASALRARHDETTSDRLVYADRTDADAEEDYSVYNHQRLQTRSAPCTAPPRALRRQRQLRAQVRWCCASSPSVVRHATARVAVSTAASMLPGAGGGTSKGKRKAARAAIQQNPGGDRHGRPT